MSLVQSKRTKMLSAKAQNPEAGIRIDLGFLIRCIKLVAWFVFFLIEVLSMGYLLAYLCVDFTAQLSYHVSTD
jgi:hypothetical protein